MEEIWKDVKGYEGLYQVSNLGRVKSVDRILNGRKYGGKILSPARDSKGYLYINLCKGNIRKIARIHRLIAECFIPKSQERNYVDHINGVRDDNRIENLRWCTHQENDSFPISRLHRSQSAMGNKRWLGKHHKEESKRKISEARKGRKNPKYWENLRDESRNKLRHILKRASIQKQVKVDQYSLDGKLIKTWDGMTVAARTLGVRTSNIFKCCNNLSKTCGSFIWKYHK